MAKILAFAGSARRDSFNKKLVRVATDFARAAGTEVTLIDLRDFAIPMYDGDLEEAEGMPADAKKLREIFLAHPGLLISTPEYNSMMPPLLKNSLDWITRSVQGDDRDPFEGKLAATLSASPGGMGGIRSLTQFRAYLSHVGCLVMPEMFALSKAHEAFNPDGSLKNEKQAAQVREIASGLATLLKKLS